MATVSLILWKYKSDKNKRHSVKLSVNHQNQRRYYAVRFNGSSSNLYLSPSEFSKAITFRNHIGKELKSILHRAESSLNFPFSWSQFEANYLHKSKSFFQYFQNHLEKLSDRPGTFYAYKNALQKWKSVTKDFQPIELLNKLHLLESSCRSKTTSAMYLRATRAIYNLIRKDFPNYPQWNYRISTNHYSHKGETLTKSQLITFAESDNLSPNQCEAKRLFMISLFAGGMNFSDLLNLKWSDIDSDKISFVREKTKRTFGQIIEIPLTDELKKYIGFPNGSPYIISNFNRIGTPLQINRRKKWFIGNINHHLKSIAKQLNLPPITTYSARHTFASILRFNGVSREQISELLGHSSIHTTNAYLRRFDVSTKAEAIKTIQLRAS